MACGPPFVPFPCTPAKVRGEPRAGGEFIPKLITPRDSLKFLKPI